MHSAHTPCRHSARAALHIHSHSCVCSPAAHARRAELGSIAQVRKKFPSISSVHNARVQDLRYALETCGEDAVGTKSDVAPRLIAVLGLQPRPTNLDGYHGRDKDSKSSKSNPKPDEGRGDLKRTNDNGRDEEKETESKKQKPPPPDDPKPEWEKFIHSASQRPYWHNTKTGKTQWNDPFTSPSPLPKSKKPLPPSDVTSVASTNTSTNSIICAPTGANELSGHVMNRAGEMGGRTINVFQAGAFASGCIVHLSQLESNTPQQHTENNMGPVAQPQPLPAAPMAQYANNWMTHSAPELGRRMPW